MLPRICRIAFVLGLALISLSALAEEAIVTAVWKPQRATFVYTGTATRYTCSALEQRIKRVLQTLGAHDRVVFERGRCSEHSPSRLDVTFKSPVLASAENIHLATHYGARERLTAMLHARALPTAADLPRFDATWKEVSFVRSRQLRIEATECELVNDIRRQLLPRLSVRVLTDRVSCVPGYPGITPPRLTVSALVALESDGRVKGEQRAGEE